MNVKPRLCSDIISTLPQNIIETILCLLPIQDAVRTSILARNWRHNWVKIPKLVFDYKRMFEKSIDENQLEQNFIERPSERKNLSKRCKVFYAIFQVLLLHEGPIHEFTLFMNANDDSVEIDQIICHLSKRNTLKKLTLHLKYILRYKVPVSIFSMHQLTHLYLLECDLDKYQPTFNVFGSLTSLYMVNVNTNTNTILHIISKSPLLKSLTVIVDLYIIYNYNNESTVTELFKCLPVLEHLCVSFWFFKCFDEDPIPRALPTSLVNLKYLYLDDVCFNDKDALPFFFLCIRCSPNVEKIKIFLEHPNSNKPLQSEIDSVTLEDYSDIWLGHLHEIEIRRFTNLKPEIEFLMFILAKSPVLKKVMIMLYHKVTKDEELEVLRILLSSPRASAMVKIFIERRDYIDPGDIYMASNPFN